MGDLAKDINSTFPSEHVKALINIKYTANYLDQIGAAMLKPFGISEPQYNILRILRGAGKEITVNQVKERMVQKSPNTTRLMDKLCEKSLIRRKRCENDRRVVYVEILDKGEKLLEAILFDGFDPYLKQLSKAEAIQLNSLLDKIRK
ncbi:MAG: MarR family transcriptional regulator [Lutimonas sp.]